MKTHSCLVMSLILMMSFSQSYAQWKQVPLPASQSGVVYDITFNDDKMYAAIRGGVYMSNDGGLNWLNINPDLSAREYSVYVISIAPIEGAIAAAFTLPGVYIIDEDGRSSFRADLNGLPLRTPFSLSSQGKRIMASAFKNNAYLSLDNGITWRKIDSLYNGHSIVISGDTIIAAGSRGIYFSADSGDSWTKTASFSSSAVAVSGKFAFAAGTSLGHEIYMYSSTNSGLTWSQDSISIPANRILSIIFNPAGNYVFASTTSGVFRSTDNGATWIKQNSEIDSIEFHSLTFKPNGTNQIPELFAATNNGIYRSPDYGETWHPFSTPSKWAFTSLGSTIFAASNTFDGTNLGNIYKSSIYKSENGGQNWVQVYSGDIENTSQIRAIQAVSTENGGYYLLAKSQYIPSSGLIMETILMFSETEGWKNISPNNSITNLEFKADSSKILISTYPHGLLRSTDLGYTWTKVDTNFVSYFYLEGNKIYTGRIESSINPRNKMIFNNRINVSTDNGITWQQVHSPLDSITQIYGNTRDTLSVISSILSSGDHLLVGSNSLYFYTFPEYNPEVYGGGVAHLVKSGTSWNLADTSFYLKSVFDFAAAGSQIFAGLENGVFRTDDYGTTWTDVSEGLNNVYVSDLFTSGGNLYASTIKGFYTRPLSEITNVENAPEGAPAAFTLNQNYPNPFNPSTVIKYSLLQAEKVQLKVFDVLGREIKTLTDEFKEAGTYEVKFDAASLASGIYFFRLTAGNYYEVKKMMLIR